MKKVLPLLVLASTCLASCGNSSFYGKYKFLLGKQGDEETRVSLEMELKDEVADFKEGYKKFEANFEMSGIAGEGSDDTTSQALSTLLEVMSGGEEEAKGIPGFYNISDLVDPKYGNKVKIAFDLGELTTVLSELDVEIDPTEVVSNFVVSYCNGKTFTFQLPVSLYDIQMQLTWHGIYIDMDPYLKDKVNTINDIVTLAIEGKISEDTFKIEMLKDYFDNKLPGEQDPDVRHGSHPSETEVKEMNEKYQGYFSNTFVYENIVGHAGNKIGTIYEEINEKGNYYFFPFDKNFNNFNTPIDVILKKDVGVFDYDFSKDTEVTISVVKNDFGDGSYSFTYVLKDTSQGEWDWSSFYKKPFTFRDFHDIHIQLKKE